MDFFDALIAGIEIAINNWKITLPILFIGMLIYRHKVTKVVTTKDGKTKTKILGENLTHQQASKITAKDMENYEFEHTKTEKGPGYNDFHGETKGGTWLSWLWDTEEEEKDK